MNATLLRISYITADGHVERLTIRDLTIDCGDTGLFDLRKGGLVLDLRHVRILGFDAAHGGAYIFSSVGALIRAEDCEFLGGYGRHPGSGYLFRHHPFIARFTRCQFELFELNLEYIRRPSRILFRRCGFAFLSADPQSKANPRIAFDSCKSGQMVAGHPPYDSLRRDLNELFPGAR